jgi:hypothetical protein
MTASTILKCYRVWFKDDSAVLVDATDETEATRVAMHNAVRGAFASRTVKSVECLTA